MKKNLLIIEDNERFQESFWRILKEKVNLYQAYNLIEAEKIFDENKDILDFIALDWRIPSEWSRFKDTVELAKHIKGNFNWIIFSITLSSEIKDDFKQLWLEILSLKLDLINRIESIIKESKKNKD